MSLSAPLSFDNTQQSFAYKKSGELKKAHFLFSVMGKPWLVNLGLKLTPLAIKWHLPFTKWFVRNTIFQQFVGGETLSETSAVAQKLVQYNVQVILDYGVEGGEEGEKGFDHATEQFIRVIEYAATQSNIPFMSVKVTGLARFALLEKLDELMASFEGDLETNYAAAMEQLSVDEQQEWQCVNQRLEQIFAVAAAKKIGVLIDAEETWIQDPIDALTMLMMADFNKQRVVVYNTLQLYRHDRYVFLQQSCEAARDGGFLLGVKLVRGAYMEKERLRAAEMNYPSPIQASKPNTDKDFDAAVDFCLDHLDAIALIIASHNEQSNLKAAAILQQKNIALAHPHVHFSQLYGMSDNITFNLAQAGCSVSKYLPFGPIEEVIPYLMRRAQENSSVSGQTGRELVLIKKELARRKGE